MKLKLKLILLCLVLGVSTSCFEDLDDNGVFGSEIKDFVWKGMNAFYLYKADVPDLANDRFATDDQYADYLNTFETPESLFESLIYMRETVDRFSVITDDYIALEQLLTGTSKSNGLEYNFYFKPGSTTEVFGIIRLVLNNSMASSTSLQRGQVFDAVDGTALTEDNLNTLLNQDTYTLNLASYNDNGTPDDTSDDTIDALSDSVTLTKETYTENPIHRTAILDVDGENVGYLVYNGFNSNFQNQLNDAFANFQANNVQHLVLDLRYNPGGSVFTASLLGSMITGQFNTQVFSKLFYNSDLSEFNTTFDYTNSFNGTAVNSLGLTKVYVLTTNRSASASELVINSLKPYIDVVQIGDFTTGKTQASITIYDSPDFSSNNVNPNHTYAMQPLVANSTNVSDQLVPSNGIEPTIELIESPQNFGTLGDINEPLLAAALADIAAPGRSITIEHPYEALKTTININKFEDHLYIDKGDIPLLRRKLLGQQ